MRLSAKKSPGECGVTVVIRFKISSWLSNIVYGSFYLCYKVLGRGLDERCLFPIKVRIVWAGVTLWFDGAVDGAVSRGLNQL